MRVADFEKQKPFGRPLSDDLMTSDSTRDGGADAAHSAPAPGPSLQFSGAIARPLDESLGRADFQRRLADLVRGTGAHASRVWIFRAAADGRLVPVLQVPRVAGEGAPAELAALRDPIDPAGAGDVVADAWRSRRLAFAKLEAPAAPWGRAWALGAFAFRTDGEAERLLVASWDEPDDGAEAAFGAMAREARDAAGRLELREAVRRAEEQRLALTEWLSAGAAAHHLSEALRAAARAMLRASGADAAAIWTTRGEGAPLELVMTAGELRERESLARALAPRATAAAARALGEIVTSVDADPGEGGSPVALASAAFAPVVAYGRVLGVLAAMHAARPVDAASVEEGEPPVREGGLATLSAIADGLGMVLDRAERTDAARASEQLTRELRARLRRRERLASAGERASGALGEARHPLASIGAFARRAHREMEEGDPRREYLEVILRESERLERLISESAEPVLPEPARFRMESLNAVLQDVLPGVGEKLVRRRVRLLKRLDPESPRLLLDAERIRQVFRNVIDRAVDSVPVGGRVRVESRLVRDHVIAEVAYDGGKAPGDLLAELFVPFTPSAAGGAPGLGVADQIIRQHGGEVRVRADGEWGASVLITLPVRGNEERRRAGEDRRLTRNDRRQPARSESVGR